MEMFQIETFHDPQSCTSIFSRIAIKICISSKYCKCLNINLSSLDGCYLLLYLLFTVILSLQVDKVVVPVISAL